MIQTLNIANGLNRKSGFHVVSEIVVKFVKTTCVLWSDDFLREREEIFSTYFGSKWLMHLPLTMKEHFFNDSPKLSIWMLVEYQGHFRYTLIVVIAIKPMP